MTVTNILSRENRAALLALGRISEGYASFLNVIDADELVRLGLADRYGAGQYTLTRTGEETLRMMARSQHAHPSATLPATDKG